MRACKIILPLFLLCILSACAAPTLTASDDFAFTQNERLRRSVNLGNALEAPNEGEWGMTLEADFFKIIREGGFEAVRVPIRWSAHAAQDPPYTIDPAFFDRIDWVVEQALANDLAVILDLHHYEEIMPSPSAHRERFLALWDQIAQHYQSAPDSVFFELLNEPNGKIAAGGTWNELLVRGIETVRQTNPRRTIIVGPVDWNSIDRLSSLALPEEERNLIVTVHYYQPFHFTHQGAEWAEGADAWLGTTWSGSEREQLSLRADLEKAARWGTKNRRPIFLGEFGAYSKADMDSRALWTAFVAREAEKLGISWAYWEFGAGFGVYDREKGEWVEPIHTALIP